MPAQPGRRKWFIVTNPDGLVRRREALSLIGRHSDGVRVFEDLSDVQINMELPAAWHREHDQADLFRDALPEVANDEYYPSLPRSLRRLLHTLAFDR
jgi:hypothetical protein